MCNSLLTNLSLGSFPVCVGVQPDTFQTCSLFSLNGRSCRINCRCRKILCPTSSMAAASIVLVSRLRSSKNRHILVLRGQQLDLVSSSTTEFPLEEFGVGLIDHGFCSSKGGMASHVSACRQVSHIA